MAKMLTYNRLILWSILYSPKPVPATQFTSPRAFSSGRVSNNESQRDVEKPTSKARATPDDRLSTSLTEAVNTAKTFEQSIIDKSLSKTPRHAKPPPAPVSTQSSLHRFGRPPEEWGMQKKSLKQKFGEEGWNPRRKLSPDAQRGIRELYALDPTLYSTPRLAAQFKVSPEAIRRILRSKWLDNAAEDKVQERRERWAKRHDRIWDQQSELGLKPKRRGDTRPDDAASGADRWEEDMEARKVLERARAD